MATGQIRKNLKYDVRDIEVMNPEHEYVDLSDVNDYINQIESDVNDIKDKLEEYNVFIELNDICKLLNELSDKLY